MHKPRSVDETNEKSIQNCNRQPQPEDRDHLGELVIHGRSASKGKGIRVRAKIIWLGIERQVANCCVNCDEPSVSIRSTEFLD